MEKGIKEVEFVLVKKKAEEAHDYLFQKGGIRDKIKEFITKRAIWSWLTLFLTVGILAFITINNMWAESRHFPEKLGKIEEATTNHEKRLTITEMKEIEIERRVTKIEQNQEKILTNTENILTEMKNK